MSPVDSSGQEVISFASALRNASRLATYADLIVNMYQSGTWRHYQTAIGPEQWRAHEFDYFLIACDAVYGDIVRILAWDTVRAAKIAEAMTGEASKQRRAFTEASEQWRSPTGVSLLEIGQRNGWLSAHQRLKPAVSKRALIRARHDMAGDEYARRRRALALREQRPALDAIVALILRRAKDDPQALRYIIDQLRRRLPDGRPRKRDRWQADIEAVNGNREKLAARWQVSRATVRQRIRRKA